MFVIAYGIFAGAHEIVPLDGLLVIVDESKFGFYWSRMLKEIEEAPSGVSVPLSPDGCIDGFAAHECCYLAMHMADASEYYSGMARGSMVNLPLSWAAVTFSEEERRVMRGYFRSQHDRVAFGPNYGGRHYQFFKKGWTRAESDFETWIQEGV